MIPGENLSSEYYLNIFPTEDISGELGQNLR